MKNNLIKISASVYFLLKPFYLFKSGTLQIADIFLCISFFLFIFYVDTETKKEILKKHKYFNIFVLIVFIISMIYTILYLKIEFMISAIYYLYNILGIYVITFCAKDVEFKKMLKKIFEINIIIQFILYVLKMGVWYGNVRYMGTFNDPNQFAFYIFIALIITDIINEELSLKKNLLVYFVSIYMILKSASTGVMLGLIIFIFKLILVNLKKINIKNLIGFIIFLILPIGIICGFYIDNFNIKSHLKNNFIISRFEDKLSRIESEEGNIFQERGYDKILKYPYYVIWGAGHGYNERFSTFHLGEIHATFPSILFYYGLMSLFFVVLWINQNIILKSLSIKLNYLAVILESFTLLNERQLMFWIMFFI